MKPQGKANIVFWVGVIAITIWFVLTFIGLGRNQ
jgi:hypothetical protein